MEYPNIAAFNKLPLEDRKKFMEYLNSLAATSTLEENLELMEYINSLSKNQKPLVERLRNYVGIISLLLVVSTSSFVLMDLPLDLRYTLIFIQGLLIMASCTMYTYILIHEKKQMAALDLVRTTLKNQDGIIVEFDKHLKVVVMNKLHYEDLVKAKIETA